MSGLTWLHLSDWHHEYFGTDRKVVRDRLIKDIEERTAISPNLDKIDFIVFSGDAASSGLADEYNEAKKEFFDHILKAAGDVSPRRLFIVPGNHDLDENEIRKLPDDFQRNAVSKEDVDNWLPDATKRNILLRPFRDFKSFVADYTGQDSPDFSNVRIWKIKGKIISLLGINSAWWCRHHRDAAGEQNDYGFLMVGEPQIHVPLDRISQSDLRIAVLHHSQDWLEYFDGNKIWSRLRQECDFILHGHGHEPKVTAEHGTSGDCVIIPAGASFKRRVAKDPSHINSYNFVHLDFATGKGTVFLRRWIDGRTEWARDDQTHPEGEFSFNLPGHVIEPPGPSVSSSVPQQIPPPPLDFTGREDEIKSLLEQFGQGATITGLRGMGGIGKTALALAISNQLRDSFPDGQIYLNMLGTGTKSLATTEAMAHVIRSFQGPAAPLPDDLNGLSGFYHSVLSEKEALILLDNAASREQVEPLLPPQGSALLITSRNKFALPGLKEKDLDILLLEDARNLLLKIAERIGEQAGELATLCGCLPLALRNAAYVLKEKPNISAADYAKRLADARKRLELVEASFDLSYQLLPEELKGLWCLLSVFPADFDLAGAVAVWGMEKESSEDALGELVKWSLVDYLPSASGAIEGRYRLHDLARDFARSRLEAAALEPARLRHAEHYRNRLSTADGIFEQGKEDFLEGLRLFDREKANILAGQSWAEKNLDDNSSAIELCKTYPDAGTYVLDLRLPPKEKIPWLKAALRASRQSKDRIFEGTHLGNLGNAYSDLGETKKAIEYYEQALKISREIGDRRGEGNHLFNMSLSLERLDQRAKAIDLAKAALKIFEQIESPSAEIVRKTLAEWKS